MYLLAIEIIQLPQAKVLQLKLGAKLNKLIALLQMVLSLKNGTTRLEKLSNSEMQLLKNLSKTILFSSTKKSKSPIEILIGLLLLE